ncbi:MAG: hypothetical protein ACRDTH_26365 [Pseudonocardiaceae bacterium]
MVEEFVERAGVPYLYFTASAQPTVEADLRLFVEAALSAYDRPSPGGPGHFPTPISTANTPGTSRYFAREDHTHRGASTHSHPNPRPVRPRHLTDAATITTGPTRGDYFRVTLGGNRTLAAPTNGTNGQRILIEALASSAQRALTLHASILLSTGITSPITIPSTSAGSAIWSTSAP